MIPLVLLYELGLFLAQLNPKKDPSASRPGPFNLIVRFSYGSVIDCPILSLLGSNP